MRMLVLNAAQLKQLDILNARGPKHRQLCTVELADGSHALNADVLTDIGKGGTWEHYRSLLVSLPARDVAVVELPTDDTPDRLWSLQKVAERLARIPRTELEDTPAPDRVLAPQGKH